MGPLGSAIKHFGRYQYANNNPYRFIDPDGRYACVGSSGDCEKVKTFVAALKEASTSSNLSRAEQSRVSRLVRVLAREGKGEITIRVMELPGNTVARSDQRGTITIDPAKQGDGKIPPENYGAMGLGHEVKHEIDARRNGPARTRDEARVRETDAYEMEALIGKGVGYALSREEIARGIESSLSNAFGPEDGSQPKESVQNEKD